MKIRDDRALNKTGAFACSFAMALALLGAACGGHRGPEGGAVVVHREPGQAAARAGIETGDIIVHWRRGDLGGPIDSPFDLALVEQREAPVGPVELTLRRGRHEVQTVVQTGVWQVETRPVLPREILSRLRHVEDRLADGQTDAVELDALAHRVDEMGTAKPTAWLDIRVAIALDRLDRTQDAHDRLERAARAILDPLDRAIFWEQAGHHLLEASRVPPAAEAFETARDLHRALGTNGPLVAHLLLQQCRAAPRMCGPKAQTALATYRAICAQSMEASEALNLTGTSAFYRSEWDTAEDDYRQGLAIVRQLAPDSPTISAFLGNLGLVAIKKGDFHTARSLFRQSFAEAQRVGSPPEHIGYAANYLGLVAKKMGQLEEARRSYQRALEAFRAFRPGGVGEAGILTNLGNVALNEEDFRSARILHQQALEIRARIAPESADVAASLNNLGVTLRRMGRYEEASQSLEDALKIKRRLAPQSGWVSNSVWELGEVARLQGRYDDAVRLHGEALELRTRVAPDHPRVAESLFMLGATHLEDGRPAEAEEFWRRAIAIAERCRSRMSLSEEEQALFGGTFFGFYRSMAELLVVQGRVIEAFDLIEKARTGALCALLTDQNRVMPGVPRDLWFEKTRNEGRITRVENQRARISIVDHPDRLEQLNRTLSTLRDEQTELLRRIGAASPRFTTISRLRPMGFSEIATVLDPGTVLLSYVIGESRSLLMTVTLDAGGQAALKASVLPLGTDELSLKVDIFRALISRGRTGAPMEPALKSQAERLFRVLIEPCREIVESADRVLILPDGPLLALPFAALIDPREGVFLGQWKALVFNPSAGVAAGIKRLPSTANSSPPELVAFGDPLPSSGAADGMPAGLGRLPGSRSEVESISLIFGNHATVFLGRKATESAVRALTPGATYVHFAVHALSDKRIPLKSALFLSPESDHGDDPGDDGVLTAFEIMNELAFDAEVVTLSACGTAGGREVPGEGIVGLARAFQFAGARSVVVTQWPVSDQWTASLMRGFYLRLEKGMGPAEALREAQRDQLMLGGAPGHPFNWAAFQVMGGWAR